MKTIDFSYFIERFIAGDMDETEKKWFLKEMEGNQGLRHEVDIRMKTDKILEKQDILNLRRKLARIESERAGVTPAIKRGRIKYAAAIALLIIVSGGAILLTSRTTLTGDQIIERYYNRYEAAASTRSGMESNNPEFNLALDYYKIHDYKNAAILFSKVINNEPGDMHSTFLNGVSNFEISNYPEAKSSFSRVIANDDNLFIDHAEWYLALCYIRTGEMEKAKDQLRKIIGTESIYRKEARQVLRRL